MRNIEDIYPLSPMQQGMLFHSVYAPESAVYFEQSCWSFQGPLDIKAFEKAWNEVVNRHTALRTAFVWENLEEPLQVVHHQVDVPLEVMDWRTRSRAEQEKYFQEFLQEDRKQGFDLSQAPLMRLTLIRLSDDTCHFVWSHHHLLFDGWSLPIVLGEVFSFYRAYQRGQHISLPPARPYRDYIAWLKSQSIAEAEKFWRERLKGLAGPTRLGIDRAVTAGYAGVDGAREEDLDYASEDTLLSGQIMDNLQSVARRFGLTLNTIVQAAWALLLSQYSGEDDVIFGATVSGRPPDLPGSETMVGLFINTLPIRVVVPRQVSTVQWMKELQAEQSSLRRYEHVPLVEIQGWSEVPRNQALFEILFVFENYPMDVAVKGGDSEVAVRVRKGPSFSRTNYPLTLAVSPSKVIGLQVAYETGRFSGRSINRMLEHFGNLLTSIAEDPNKPVDALSLLGDSERRTLLVEWKPERVEYSDGVCAHKRFEALAQAKPDAVALSFGDHHMTNAELDCRSNQLAHYLRQQGVARGTLVALCLEPSPEMIIGILGILKAGGAYLPVDPSYPVERVKHMLEDSGANFLLTQEALKSVLHEHSARTFFLDSQWSEISLEDRSDIESHVDLDDLAYVIYTSGSTGVPKGTVLHHRGLSNMIDIQKEALRLRDTDRMLQFAAFSFDASVWEIFLSLGNAVPLQMADRELLASPERLHRLLQETMITIVTLPPSMLKVLPHDGLPQLRIVISAGEKCTRDIVARWAPGRTFINGYGPTETTVCATLGFIDEVDRDPVIGRPISNTAAYVLDPRLRLLPVGIPGELHLSGVHLSYGYLNRPDLTAERFVPDPFSDRPGGRLYKTGDLVRFRPDGNLEYLGRIDHQVKVRGFRIELGEIESVLTQHPAVRLAAVLAHQDDDGSTYLAAYVEPEAGQELTSRGLRDFLNTRLPDYMIPSVYFVLEGLPMLPSGKVDRRALPVPEKSQSVARSVYAAPRNPVEEGLAELWSSVLGVEKVGIHDNFFELGGHSLRATQLISRVRETFGVDLQLRQLFEMPTVAALATKVEAALREESGVQLPPIVRAERDGELPLSFSQQRLWFLDQLSPGNLFYNIPTALLLRGRLQVGALARALNEIVRRHEVLRTTFQTVQGRPVQVIAENLEVEFPLVDLNSIEGKDAREAEAREVVGREARRPFDLSTGPLLRAYLLRLSEEEHIFLLTTHHIVSDGWSMGVFFKEMTALYKAFSEKEASPLPELPVQYADYAMWQREWLQGELLERHLDFWKKQLAGSPPLLELPTDRPRPAMQTANGAILPFSLPKHLADSMRKLSREEGATLFMTMLAAFQCLLYRYSGQEDICVGTPVANRNIPEIEGLIGFFVNTLVLRTDLSGNPSFRELVRRVREVALQAYAHQDLPFEMLVEALQPQRDMSHTPLFQVMFVMDTPTISEVDLSDLKIRALRADTGAATFDLTLSLTDSPEGLGGYVEYNTDLFDSSTIQRMLDSYQTLLEAIADDADQRIRRLPVVTPAEERLFKVEWNNTAQPFPSDMCAHQLFESQVAERPNAVAAIFGEERLSYAELNARANQLARHLRKLGVGPDVPVGICTDRSLEMIVGILGILKAGGAYLPLDPTYPQERLAFMLQDSGVKVLLSQQRLAQRLPAYDGRIILLDSDWPAIEVEDSDDFDSGATADNLAYVIYTSGSTGVPKGTMLQHRGLCNLTRVQMRAFHVGEGSRILQFSPFSFDASVWETFMALANGATICLAPQEVLASGIDLVRLLRETGITNITLPPSVLGVLPEEELPKLETIIAAGEACTADLVERWAGGRAFFNAYGPTETTVCASMYRCSEDEPGNPPIGRPISNTRLYVLDADLQFVPIGVPGELHVAGVSLARGYLNRPDLTAEKFIPDPFAPEPGQRLYRTGDLVRYRADGNIEFLGRIDQQVKLRGFRIELGEVEAVLGQHPNVLDSVAVVREDVPRDQRLVAYVVPRDEVELTSGELRSFLRQKLPEYMVPSGFVVLEALPLSPSGKVDRSALPAPEATRPDVEVEYVAPRNEVEGRLASILAELLGVEKVGIYDNFFDLGGHSLLATQFISRVREEFQIELPLRSLFETPTIEALAKAVEKAKQEGGGPEVPSITRVSRESHRMKRSDLS